MPLKLRAPGLARDLLRLASPNVCPSCELQTSLRIIRFLQNRTRLLRPTHARAASTLASSTAVNAKKDIPHAFQDLHRALEKLNRDAPSYVNLSRLQLALRGLESATPVTRIAVLGLQSQRPARHVARLLLADALTDEGAWERQLEDLGADDQRGLLLRYGDETDPPAANALVSTLHVPSRILERQNIEILISSIRLPASPSKELVNLETLKTAALIPTAEAPKSFSGSISFITYPVHRALVVAEGVQGLLSLGRYVPTGGEASHGQSNTLQLAIELPALAGQPDSANSAPDVTILDTGLARQALSEFRQSTANGTVYEQGWFNSGMPALSKWFSQGPENDGAILNPAVTELIHDLLNDTLENITTENEAKEQEAAQPEPVDKVRQHLDEALIAWAKSAHTELRDKLDEAFASAKWARLAWWKLFWRVDDVTMLTSEIFERSWLVDAEKGMIYLAGRRAEAGFPDDAGLRSDPPPSVTVTSTSSAVASTPTTPAPWPTAIPAARNSLLVTAVPSLQALAQRLLLQTLSISSFSVALSALLYVSIQSASLFSVGAVAALGCVWSLRRMQRQWENGREAWEGEVRESGRVVLREAEARWRAIGAGVGSEMAEGEEARERRVAISAVVEARAVLDDVVRSTKGK